MAQFTLPIRPEDATKALLKKLSARRMRDVLEKRFALKGGRKKTLEAIGREYKITRERVRQIETDALRQLARPENYREMEPLFSALHDQMSLHGEVVAEQYLFGLLPHSRQAPHVAFLLNVGRGFSELPESASLHRRWTTNKQAADAAEKIIEKTIGDLEGAHGPVSSGDLDGMIARNSGEVLGRDVSESARDSILHLSKAIRQNPYGEFGLVSWPTIHPRGVKDKAYLVLSKAGKPMHFRDVAQAINKTGWSKRRAHPQTVHNELIKDHRFVLVGRGLYGLKDWGYEPGTVRDILVSVMKQAGKPLTRDEAVKLVLEKRFVKAPTVLLNLQDKSRFKRLESEKYTLV